MDSMTTLESDLVRIALAGRFDAHESDEVKAELLEHLANGRTHLGLDLAEVIFVDSSALAVMTSVMKRCREAGGDLEIIDPSNPVRVILELTSLDQAFVIR